MLKSALAMITSTANRTVVEVRKLRQRKHRQEQGLFLLEGLQLLTMALDAGLTPTQVFYCPEQAVGPQSRALVERFSRTSPLLLVAPHVMNAISEREGPQGVMATFPLFSASLSAIALTGRDLILVLDRPQDPGNLGGMIRTADAVGAAGVLILEPAVDLFDPKTIRASMGSVFNLPIVLAAEASVFFGYLRERGVRTVGASEHASTPWGEEVLNGSVALVLGNEAHGLSPDVTAHIDQWVSLPMRGKAESLNVSVAGGVLMYFWLRRNST